MTKKKKRIIDDIHEKTVLEWFNSDLNLIKKSGVKELSQEFKDSINDIISKY